MNRQIFFYMLMLLAGSVFVACSDDDNDSAHYIEPGDSQAAAEWVAGNYDGTMGTVLTSANFNNMEFPDTANQKVEIVYDSLDYVTVRYKDWTNGGMNYGDLIVSPVKVSFAEDEATLVLSGSCVQKLYKEGRGFDAEVTVAGTVDERQCLLVFTVNMPVSPVMTLDFTLTYDGKREE